MVTPRKKPALRAAPPPEDEQDEIVGLLPMNRNGEVVPGRGAWQLPVGMTGMTGDEEEPLDQEEPEPETPADRIFAMLADVGDDPRAFVKVSRITNTGKVGWCEDVPVAEFEMGGMTRIREKWGAGNFQVILYGMQPGSKRFVIRTRAQIEIVPTAPGAPVSLGGQPQNELAPVLEQLLARLGAQTPPVSPDEQMLKMLTMMKLMREAMGTDAPAAKGSNLSDTLALVRELKGATKLFEKGDDKEDDGPMAMISKLVPGILAAAQQQRPQPAPQATPQAALPAPQPQEGAPLLAPGVEQMMTPFEAIKLRGTLTTLLALAASKADIPESAEYLLQNLPDQFMDMMETDDWWTALVGVAPAVAPHGEWFANVRAQAIAFLDEDEANAQDEQTPGGALAGDVADDAAAEPPAAPPPVPSATIVPAKRGKKPAAAANADPAA